MNRSVFRKKRVPLQQVFRGSCVVEEFVGEVPYDPDVHADTHQHNADDDHEYAEPECGVWDQDQLREHCAEDGHFDLATNWREMPKEMMIPIQACPPGKFPEPWPGMRDEADV